MLKKYEKIQFQITPSGHKTPAQVNSIGIRLKVGVCEHIINERDRGLRDYCSEPWGVAPHPAVKIHLQVFWPISDQLNHGVFWSFSF